MKAANELVFLGGPLLATSVFTGIGVADPAAAAAAREDSIHFYNSSRQASQVLTVCCLWRELVHSD
jgi:hypothetical protein